jgi:hypothetical protein
MFRFFTGSIIGMIIGVIVGVVTLVVVLGVIVFALAAIGGPGECTSGGAEIAVSAANADAFDRKWKEFDNALNSGSPSSVTFNESEITSRAERFIEDEAGDIGHVRICVHDGFGELTGRVGAFLGIDVDFSATGTVDLSGDHPVVDFDDIEIGSVPGFVVGPFKGFLEDAVEELTKKIELEHRLVPTLSEGEARVDGQP